jgi:hypothetical protein
MMPGSEVSRAPAMAPPCSLAAGGFSPPSPPVVTVSRRILDLPPGLEVTGSAGTFAKESLEILNIEPAVQGVFPNCVFFFVKRSLISVTSEIRFHLFTVLPLG